MKYITKITKINQQRILFSLAEQTSKRTLGWRLSLHQAWQSGRRRLDAKAAVSRAQPLGET